VRLKLWSKLEKVPIVDYWENSSVGESELVGVDIPY
jgi:hypothetical protein